MSESYEEKINELKKSISNFTEIDVEQPLGQKIREKLGNTYNRFLQEEINCLSEDIQNLTLRNLLKNNSSESNDYEDFPTYYEKFVTDIKKDIDFDFDQFEDLLEQYSYRLLDVSEEINKLEQEIIKYFKNVDQVRQWVDNIPEYITFDSSEVEEQIDEMISNEEIKDKLKNYKNLKMKYYFLKHYFFINPFISLAEDDNINCNENEFTYKNDLEAELNSDDEIVETSPSLLKSFLNLFF
jgi:hypothetical protein